MILLHSPEKWISNDWMLSSRMILRLFRIALTASNTVSDIFWSIRILKYLPCRAITMNLNVRFSFIVFLTSCIATHAKRDLHRRRKTIWTPTLQEAPDNSGAFFVWVFLIHGEHHLMILCHLAHVDDCVSHSSQRCIDAYARLICYFLKT